MVYSHWPSPGPRHGRIGCMVLYRAFHIAPEQGQGRMGSVSIFQVLKPISGGVFQWLLGVQSWCQTQSV